MEHSSNLPQDSYNIMESSRLISKVFQEDPHMEESSLGHVSQASRVFIEHLLNPSKCVICRTTILANCNACTSLLFCCIPYIMPAYLPSYALDLGYVRPSILLHPACNVVYPSFILYLQSIALVLQCLALGPMSVAISSPNLQPPIVWTRYIFYIDNYLSFSRLLLV
ncbi:hypothetical protein Adt_23554 [Abeliophyllum distichum]|uniref:Uncharacterized protein n=1 Tax=Abeliophyllum distichum TaxID=126358 RepID=A0ABD1SB74_9LAMI